MTKNLDIASLFTQKRTADILRYNKNNDRMSGFRNTHNSRGVPLTDIQQNTDNALTFTGAQLDAMDRLLQPGDNSVQGMEELNYFTASPCPDITYNGAVWKDLPAQAQFRAANQYVTNTQPVVLNIPFNLKYLDFTWYADVATVSQGSGGMTNSNLAYTQAIMSQSSAYAAAKMIGANLWTGAGDASTPAGLPGIITAIKAAQGYDASFLVNGGDAITATDSRADGQVYTVWAVTTGANGINFSWGKNGYLESGPVIPGTLTNNTGQTLEVWKQVQGAWFGTYVGTANCFAKGVFTGGVDAPSLRKLITAMVKQGQRPDALFMSYGAWDSYRNSVTVHVANETGVQGNVSETFDGIKVIRTVNIVDAPAPAPAP